MYEHKYESSIESVTVLKIIGHDNEFDDAPAWTNGHQHGVNVQLDSEQFTWHNLRGPECGRHELAPHE